MKLSWKVQRRVVILSLMLLIWCIRNIIKNLNLCESYTDSVDWITDKKVK